MNEVASAAISQEYFQDGTRTGPKAMRLKRKDGTRDTYTMPLPQELAASGKSMIREKFIVEGSGVILFEDHEQEPFTVLFKVNDSVFIALHIVKSDNNAVSKIYLIQGRSVVECACDGEAFIDEDPNAPYWVSFFGAERMIKYGMGEAREALALIKFKIPWEHVITDDELKRIDYVYLSANLTPMGMVRDPVVVEPPLRILPTSLFSMEDAASYYYGVPASMTSTCQKLYGNISGANFKLDTGDFPEFTKAIEYSIKTKGCWCYETLVNKATEFGHKHPKETYLRITLGVNQGDSPGIPYVMEIWPAGHYSPIHDHAWSHAIIRVLYGEIQAELFPMLSKYHLTPFAIQTFHQDDVTWISPALNQFHRLKNVREDGPPCITIQCYMYGEDDDTHYPYFDYLDAAKIGKFDPTSDADFLSFKQIMKDEWLTRYNK